MRLFGRFISFANQVAVKEIRTPKLSLLGKYTTIKMGGWSHPFIQIVFVILFGFGGSASSFLNSSCPKTYIQTWENLFWDFFEKVVTLWWCPVMMPGDVIIMMPSDDARWWCPTCFFSALSSQRNMSWASQEPRDLRPQWCDASWQCLVTQHVWYKYHRPGRSR